MIGRALIELYLAGLLGTFELNKVLSGVLDGESNAGAAEEVFLAAEGVEADDRGELLANLANLANLAKLSRLSELVVFRNTPPRIEYC